MCVLVRFVVDDSSSRIEAFYFGVHYTAVHPSCWVLFVKSLHVLNGLQMSKYGAYLGTGIQS